MNAAAVLEAIGRLELVKRGIAEVEAALAEVRRGPVAGHRREGRPFE